MSLGIYQANCYILSEGPDAVIIDPGAGLAKIGKALEKLRPGIRVRAILLTHGHFDHIGAVDGLYREYHCPIFLGAGDRKLATDASINCAHGRSAVIESPFADYPVGQLREGPWDFKILDTPGHTEGSVCLIAGNRLFSGDTLFRGSVGRTDLYGGSENKLRRSLELIKGLDPALQVLPGHAGPSTLQAELTTNPYLI